MKLKTLLALSVFFAVGSGVVWAADGHKHHGHEKQGADNGGVPSLTGEVVDIFCYLSHGKHGLGDKHAKCAKKCLTGGLPVGIKVGDQLYLATMADHAPANEKLLKYAGEVVTVKGKVLERDGQKLVAIQKIEKPK